MASKKRGMSLEEKRTTVLAILHESKSPWLLKDLEKAAVKKGVVQQTVKDVVQSLINDDLAVTDKIGAPWACTACYFWSFTSQAGAAVRNAHAKLSAELAAATEAADAAAEKLAAARAALGGAADAAGRAEAAAALGAAKTRRAQLAAEVEALAGGDPALDARVRDLLPAAIAAANRWMDNAQVLDDYLRKTLGADKEQAKAFWGEHAGGQDVRDWETISVATLAASLEPKPAKKAKKAKEGGASGKSSSGKAKKRKAAAEGDGDGGGGGAAAGDDY